MKWWSFQQKQEFLVDAFDLARFPLAAGILIVQVTATWQLTNLLSSTIVGPTPPHDWEGLDSDIALISLCVMAGMLIGLGLASCQLKAALKYCFWAMVLATLIGFGSLFVIDWFTGTPTRDEAVLVACFVLAGSWLMISNIVPESQWAEKRKWERVYRNCPTCGYVLEGLSYEEIESEGHIHAKLECPECQGISFVWMRTVSGETWVHQIQPESEQSSEPSSESNSEKSRAP